MNLRYVLYPACIVFGFYGLTSSLLVTQLLAIFNICAASFLLGHWLVKRKAWEGFL